MPRFLALFAAAVEQLDPRAAEIMDMSEGEWAAARSDATYT